MAEFFNAAGRRAVAVHSGESSAPRATSLQQLEDGEIDTLFAVDMFNEGVDVPAIDTILMLRPTSSAIIWTQQLGRGLRRAGGKNHLNVIDYIGNHRTFLNNARIILNAGPGDRDLSLSLESAVDQRLALPAGCEVTYDLKALDILKGLLRRTSRGDALEAYFTDFKQRFGVRPTASEIHHAGFDPRASGHGGWFQFVKRQGDLQADEDRALALHQDFLDEVSRTPMTRSYKMILLKVMQAADAFPGSMGLDDFARGFQDFAFRNPRISSDLGVQSNDLAAIRTSVRTNPIDAWSKRLDSRGRPFFTFDDSVLTTCFDIDPALRGVLNAMVAELVDWRLAKYLGRGAAP